MGIFDVFKGKASEVSSGVIVAITPAGKSKAESGFALKGNKKYEILTALAEGGATSIEELSEEVKLPTAKVQALLRSMSPMYVRIQSNNPAA